MTRVKGHKWVYEVGETLHRDISISNIMYRELDKRISGVLIDYDMSVDVDRNLTEGGSSSKQRTGTKPYTVLDCSTKQHAVRLTQIWPQHICYNFKYTDY